MAGIPGMDEGPRILRLLAGGAQDPGGPRPGDRRQAAAQGGPSQGPGPGPGGPPAKAEAPGRGLPKPVLTRKGIADSRAD